MPHSSNILETLPESEDIRSRAARELRIDALQRLGFLVLWNTDEPGTIGAFLPVLEGAKANTQVLGRGEARPADEHARLVAVRQRPQRNEALPPFESPSLSRIQLLIRPVLPARLELVNVGRRRLFVNGTHLEHAEIGPGDVIELGPQLTLLCTMRPRQFDECASKLNHAFGEPDLHGFVGESFAAWQLRSELAFASPRNGHVLVFGSTGTGKELIARAIHNCSNRTGPLVARNAATIPETLVDAELFGNMKGYPNPGMPERKGLFGAAHTGSLFLDEFGDLPSGAQAHILRVLDAGEYHRLGEESVRRSSFRLIAATNRPESTLRADIVARFEFRLRTPDLVQRREDVPLIACHLLKLMCADDPELQQRFFMPNGLPRLSGGFMRKLVWQDYTANVRELRNLLWLSVSKSRGDRLEWPEQESREAIPAGSDAPPDSDFASDELQRALDANNGSIEKTWRALGLSNRHVLNRLVRKHGLSVTKQPSRE